MNQNNKNSYLMQTLYRNRHTKNQNKDLNLLKRQRPWSNLFTWQIWVKNNRKKWKITIIGIELSMHDRCLQLLIKHLLWILLTRLIRNEEWLNCCAVLLFLHQWIIYKIIINTCRRRQSNYNKNMPKLIICK